jgi:hypothetical protein
MDCKHQETSVSREPKGNLCVVRDENLSGWAVRICRGRAGDQTPLGNFSTRGEAEDFAKAELLKLNAQPGKIAYILHVDDCPCWQKEL